MSKKKFVPVAKASEIPAGEARTFDVGHLSLAIANVDGKFHAIDNLCTHDDGPLGDGVLEGTAIECPRHGARFDVRTGAVLSMPAAFPVKSYPTRVEGDQVMVEIEE
jgi:3-phenylpropionate/trans-cinnamate dioxygenase ferredoxin component